MFLSEEGLYGFHTITYSIHSKAKTKHWNVSQICGVKNIRGIRNTDQPNRWSMGVIVRELLHPHASTSHIQVNITTNSKSVLMCSHGDLGESEPVLKPGFGSRRCGRDRPKEIQNGWISERVAVARRPVFCGRRERRPGRHPQDDVHRNGGVPRLHRPDRVSWCRGHPRHQGRRRPCGLRLRRSELVSPRRIPRH